MIKEKMCCLCLGVQHSRPPVVQTKEEEGGTVQMSLILQHLTVAFKTPLLLTFILKELFSPLKPDFYLIEALGVTKTLRLLLQLL